MPPALPCEWLPTYAGRRALLWEPTRDSLDPRDLAHHLALTNRFGGATALPYSVAQHSCHVAELCPPRLKLDGLLHDAHEAYLGDWTSPLKRHLRGGQHRCAFDWLDFCWRRWVAERFRLTTPTPSEVLAADKQLLLAEARALLPHERDRLDEWPDLDGVEEVIGLVIEPWPWDRAEREFLRRFHEYGGA